MRRWHSGYCGRLQPGFSWVRVPPSAFHLKLKMVKNFEEELKRNSFEDSRIKNKKRLIRFFLAIFFLFFGILFSFFPFIPLGYIFLLLGLFFLSSFITPLDKFLRRIEERDKKRRLSFVRKKSREIEKGIEKKLKRLNVLF